MAITRRTFISAAGGVLAAPAASEARVADPVAAPPGEVTATLVRYLVTARPGDLPAAGKREASRTLLNYVGCAIGGSQHETVERALRALSPFSGAPEAAVFGRRERLDVLHAAFLNGVSSHIFDYDDTHLKTIIHPAGPVASAILALAQRTPVDGRAFLNALVLGVEAECRIGNAVYPSHYDLGWHITGTCGAFGSAVACGKLLGLDEKRMTWALGLAASQPVGLKIQFGSMTKSFHPGRAAQNGMVAALLAQQGFTADDHALEGKDGWGQALSRAHDWSQVTQGLGERYEAALNTYKPFACGIVTHPAIDAAIQLRNEARLAPAEVEAVTLRANPLVLSLTGKTEPHTGLEGKFSIYHCVAVALVQGAAGERQFSDSAVRDPITAALRRRVTVHTDASVRPEQVDLEVRLRGGRVLRRHVEHALGSLENPMSDAALDAKFADLAQDVIPPDRARHVMDLCRRVETLDDAGEIGRQAAA